MVVKKEEYIHEQHEKKTIEQSNIPLWVDCYDDIFSIFDPRPYDKRALSDDFLQEVKRASRDKEDGGIELRFLVPKKRRDLRLENMIIKRLHEHFNKHFQLLNKEVENITSRGVKFISAGVLVMILATVLMFYYSQSNLLVSFLIVLFEPGGWFLFWEGLNLVIFESKSKKPDLDFYKKMSHSDIIFTAY